LDIIFVGLIELLVYDKFEYFQLSFY